MRTCIHYLEIDGQRLEYRWIGPGPDSGCTLVFLHEGLGSVSLWKDFPDELARVTGLGALVYSRLGYGLSDPAPLPRPVSFMHDEARETLPAVLEASGISEAVLVGHSDGGSIALIYASGDCRVPLRGLITEAPHVFVEPISLESIHAAAEAYEQGKLRRRLARHHGGNVDGAFWGWNRVWLDPDFESWNLEALLPKIRTPLLVIQGHDDPYGTMAQVDSITKNAGAAAEKLILADCGHAPHVEKRQAVLTAMHDFVSQVTESRPEA